MPSDHRVRLLGLGIARIGEDAMEPRLEAGRVTQGSELSPGRNQCGLDGVLRQVEMLEASDELIVVLDRARVVSARRIDPEERDLDRLAHPAPSLIRTRVHEQPVEPRVPALGIAQKGKPAPGLDEGILHRVLSLVCIPQDEAGEAE